MRRSGLVALLLVAACASEPDFEERYEKASEEIRARAEAIDKELETRAGQSGAANSDDAAAAATDRPGASR